jgi:hypothetical protein
MNALLFVPFLATAVACMAGAERANRSFPDWPALLAVVVLSVAMGVFIVSWQDTDVDTGTVVFGAILGATLTATGPLLAYYGLGRTLTGHRMVLALLWLASLVPLTFWLVLTLLLTAGIVSCPPDAYECPV